MGRQIGDTVIRDDGSIGSRSDPTDSGSDADTSSVPDYGSVTRDRDGDPLSGTDSDSGSDRGTPDYGNDGSLPGGNLAGGSGSSDDDDDRGTPDYGNDGSLPGGNLAGGSGSESSSPTPEQLDNLGSQLQQDVMSDLQEQYSQLEQQFQNQISQSQENFSTQIDNLSGSVTDVRSNVSESFDSVGSALEGTQNAIGSLSGSVARLFNQQEQEQESGSEPDGLSTTALAAAGAVLVGITYYVTQRDQ